MERYIWTADQDEVIRGMILEARAALRELSSGAGYTLMATGKNVEDFYMMEELRKKGVNLKQWEDSTKIDPETGEITFGPWEPPKGGRRA